MQKIMDFKKPVNRRELQRFSGMVNYYRLLIEKIAELAEQLYFLLQKDRTFVWNEGASDAFILIKDLLKGNLELNMPEYNQSFVLECDASDKGLGLH